MASTDEIPPESSAAKSDPSPSLASQFQRRQPGMLSMLGWPAGSGARVLWLGSVVMLLSFAAKQVVVDLSLGSAGEMLEEERLEAEMAVELRDIDADLDELDKQINALEGESPRPRNAESSDALKSPSAEKLDKLRKDRRELDEKLEERRKKVRTSFAPKIRDADRQARKAKAEGLGRVQTTLWLKLFLDAGKLAGGAMVILAGLRISFDPEQSAGAKAYAAVLGGIAFFSVVFGGLYALLG